MDHSCVPLLRPVLEDRLYLAQGVSSLPHSGDFRIFHPDQELVYYSPLCDDFGPMNMGSVLSFIKQLDHELSENPSCRFFYCVNDGRRNLSNAVFLVGTYMILKLGYTANETTDVFSWINNSYVEDFRDATYSVANFRLTLQDCWSGFEKGRTLGWVDMPIDYDYLWGDVDMDEYMHYDSPFNGDMHEVIPGKFIAFRGPKALKDAATHYDHHDGCRDFAPTHFAEIFADFGVELVVRLNEPEYDAADFLARGIAHLDLGFEDCAAPPPVIVRRFLQAAEQTRGAVAVHCKAGLGRTGTLIAAFMMKHYSFTARQAMGWLRIMRPGCVIGEQQHYLCELESAAGDPSAAAAAVAAAVGDGDDGGAAARGVAAAQVAAGMGRRGSFLSRSASANPDADCAAAVVGADAN